MTSLRFVFWVLFSSALAGTALAQSPPVAGGEATTKKPAVTVINPQPAAPAEAAPEEPAPPPATTAETPSADEAPSDAAAAPPASPGADVPSPPAETFPTQDPSQTSEQAAAAAPPSPPPPPTLDIDIDLTHQRMTVSEHGEIRYRWPISSARAGYRTPTGTFQPTWMAKMWYSRQYEYSPMPHSIFFHRGAAIHATSYTRQLGRPASHGCVRLAPKNAAMLYKMVGAHGKNLTRIVVHGSPGHSNQEIAGYDDRGRYGSRRYPPPGYGYGYYGYDQPYYYGPRPRRGYYYPKPRRYVQQRGYYGGYRYGYGF